MSQLLTTFLIASGLLAVALLGMGIGYFFKKKCLKKQCDVNPHDCACKKSKDKHNSC